MKKIFSLALFAALAASAQAETKVLLSGNVSLGGLTTVQVLNMDGAQFVLVNGNYLPVQSKLDDGTFYHAGVDTEQTQMFVQVHTNRDLVQYYREHSSFSFAREQGYLNAYEFSCKAEHNALIVYGDRVGLYGNCATLNLQ